MILILFVLSIYNILLEDQSNSYFQKFSFLEYGFKAKAKYRISFTTYDRDQIVFGLATKKEIKEIDKLKYFKEYCTGYKRLSNIQFNFTNNSVFTGTIPKKILLIPYSFTCSLSYKFNATFSYTNGSNNLDYRCQAILIAALIYFILVLSIVIICLFYYIYHFSKQIDEGLKKVIHFIFWILFFICFLDLYQYLFFEIKKNKEYFNERLINDPLDLIFGESILGFSFIVSVILGFGIFSLFFYQNYVNNDYFPPFCKNYILMLMSFLTGTAITYLILGDSLKIVRIFIYVSWIIYCLLMLFLKPMCSLLKGAVFANSINVFIFIPLGCTLVNQKQMCTHYLTVILAIISMFTQIFPLLLFLLFVFKVKNIHPAGGTVNNNLLLPLIMNQNTFNNHHNIVMNHLYETDQLNQRTSITVVQ